MKIHEVFQQYTEDPTERFSSVGNRSFCVCTAMSDVKVAIIASECDEKTQKLKNCIEAQDWDGYGITAHSIKGLMASIGLKELSERAKKHEHAAGDLDTEFIKTDSGSFIEAYREVCKKLR